MAAKSIVLPRRVLAGPGVLSQMAQLCAELGIEKRPFVVVDNVTKDVCGDDIVDSLNGSRMGMIGDSTFSEVERIRGLAKGASCMISAGGGKVIDVGKLAASQMGMPFMAVPTALSNDGISSFIASIKDDGKHSSIDAKVPLAVVADTEIISKAPAKLIASGAGDVLAKVSAVRDWKLGKARGESYSETAAGFSMLAVKIVMGSAEEIARRSESGLNDLLLALVTSGAAISLFGSSRPASGSEHLFSHALEALGSKALHGEQCGLGAILMSYWQEKNSRDAKLRNSGIWMKVRDTLNRAGAPTTLKEAGIEPHIAFKALAEAKNMRERYTILNEHPLDLATAQRICMATGVV